MRKNTNEKWMKKLIDEKKYQTEKMNPPFCYKY